MNERCEREESRVYVRREDGSLEPVTVPEAIAARAAIYLALRRMGMDLAEIRHVWPEGSILG